VERGLTGAVREKGVNFVFFLFYLILGAYLVNIPFNFILIPEYISKFNIWIIFVGGLLVILGAVNYFRIKRLKRLTAQF